MDGFNVILKFRTQKIIKVQKKLYKTLIHKNVY